MNRLALIALVPLAFAAPALAQPMDHASMPGMTMPTPAAKAPAKKTVKAKPKTKGKAKSGSASATTPPAMAVMPGMPEMTPSAVTPPTAPQSSHDMSAMPGMKMPGATTAGAPTPMPMPGAQTAQANMADMPGMKGMAPAPAAGHDMASMPATPEPEIPNTPPPPAPKDHAAERYFDPAVMAAARATLREEHGGTTISKVMANLAEYQARAHGDDGYRWEGQAWIGGDLNRFVLKTEGDGSRREGVDAAELQGLYSRAIGPYFNLQAGLRQDIRPRSRTYATVGFEGLAPYWFDVEGALFLSDRGELLGRLEGTYDLRLTQRLILQPRAELNFAAQDTAETRTGSGLSNAELGLRLRYEIKREFAPYVGVSYDRKFGKTGDYAQLIGRNAETTSFVAGVRAWF